LGCSARMPNVAIVESSEIAVAYFHFFVGDVEFSSNLGGGEKLHPHFSLRR
jgi:hypothetical protein